MPERVNRMRAAEDDRVGSEAAEAVRIPALPRAEWTDAARDVFAFWGEPGARENGSRTNMVMVLANHPALALSYYRFGRHLLIDSTLPARARELVVLRVAWRVRSAYEWHYHVGYAIALGLDLDEIAAIGDGPNSPGWDEHDRAVLQAVDELHGCSRLSDATWATLSRHFDRPQIIDLVFTIGNYVMLSWAIAALGIAIEDGIDAIGFDLVTASGATPGARQKPGEGETWASNSG